MGVTNASSGRLSIGFGVGSSFVSAQRATPPALSGPGGGHQSGEVRF